MKILQTLILVFVSLFTADRAFALETMQLTDEEARLVKAYRKDPTLFRQIMNGGNGGANQITTGPGVSVVGPRDVIDVSIIGGKVQIYGKNSEFENLAFRIARGETKSVTFRKKGAIAETRVVVSYRGDGLHFDIPEAYGGTTSEENGLLILPESAAWEKGEVFTNEGKLPGRVSRGENLQFKIRYALLTGNHGH